LSTVAQVRFAEVPGHDDSVSAFIAFDDSQGKSVLRFYFPHPSHTYKTYTLTQLRHRAGSCLYIAHFVPSTDRCALVLAARPSPGEGATKCPTQVACVGVFITISSGSLHLRSRKKILPAEIPLLCLADRSSDANGYRYEAPSATPGPRLVFRGGRA
jgi:hypothetical protein